MLKKCMHSIWITHYGLLLESTKVLNLVSKKLFLNDFTVKKIQNEKKNHKFKRTSKPVKEKQKTNILRKNTNTLIKTSTLFR